MGCFCYHCFAETNVLSGIHLSSRKYNVCSIKIETKVFRLHNIREYFIVLHKCMLSIAFDFTCKWLTHRLNLLRSQFNQSDLFVFMRISS